MNKANCISVWKKRAITILMNRIDDEYKRQHYSVWNRCNLSTRASDRCLNLAQYYHAYTHTLTQASSSLLTRFHSFTWFDHNTSCVQHSLACLLAMDFPCLLAIDDLYMWASATHNYTNYDWETLLEWFLSLHLFSSLHVCAYIRLVS